MQEFSFLLDRELLKLGLRPDSRYPINSMFATECFNAEVDKSIGLIQYSPVTLGISAATLAAAGITISFPFPQLFRGKSVTLLANQTTIYLVDESDWSIAAITTYDADDQTSTKSITSGGAWQFADFGDTWMLFNGNCVVFKYNIAAMFGGTDKTLVQDRMTITTGCSVEGRGRVIFGGFDTSDFWSSDWQTFWAAEVAKLPKAGFSSALPIGSNFILWSTIGGGDLTSWLFYDEAMTGPFDTSTVHSATKPYIRDLFARNELGFMPMPWQGTVLNIKSLGNGIVVYGDGGFTILKHYSDPVPTFGVVGSWRVGIASRAAVAGNDKAHIFLANSGDLWYVDQNYNPKRLGYSEYFSGMVDEEVVGSYDESEERFFISGESECFVYRDGLTQCNQLLTSVEFAEGGAIGIFEAVDDDSFLFVTDSFDCGVRGIKEITNINIGVDCTDTLEVAVYYRYNKASGYSLSPYKEANLEGVVYPKECGTDFRLVIKTDDYTLINRLSSIEIRYKVLDKRAIRGIYAGKVTA